MLVQRRSLKVSCSAYYADFDWTSEDPLPDMPSSINLRVVSDGQTIVYAERIYISAGRKHRAYITHFIDLELPITLEYGKPVDFYIGIPYLAQAVRDTEIELKRNFRPKGIFVQDTLGKSYKAVLASDVKNALSKLTE